MDDLEEEEGLKQLMDEMKGKEDANMMSDKYEIDCFHSSESEHEVGSICDILHWRLLT